MRVINEKNIIHNNNGTADPIIDVFIHPSIALSMNSLWLNLTQIISCARNSFRNSSSFIRRKCGLFSPLPPNFIDAQFYFIFYLFIYLFFSLSLSLSLIFDVAQVVGGFYSWKYLAKFWLWMRYMKEQTFQLFEKHFSQIWLWTRFLFFLSTFWCSQSGQFIIHEKI